MQFEIEAARIADWFPVLVSSPERRSGCPTIDASRSRSARRRLQRQADAN